MRGGKIERDDSMELQQLQLIVFICVCVCVCVCVRAGVRTV